MLAYELPNRDREALRPYARLVQIAIATLASERLQAGSIRPEGIFKAEGGVKVGGRDIVIKESFVKDDFASRQAGDEATPEEVATVEAIRAVNAGFKKDGEHFFDRFPKTTLRTDPLRAMLG